ncbi:Mak10 subunit, NatC N-terminal acetyltransferase-domain-containing protein [Lineolata rhizophorae]|uniref:Mak10 subunit, NatC N-terminal acetyltransferase-domain-containing protein n=1 Tax=Lineolata rhizophorae TaxID=578093 RepID=A0A6A6NRP1_9PEZI|nr:Mak10 subunit, NatC N-terminal acetyltransferase-domain-containing protein [Lineolata rhizophorae]
MPTSPSAPIASRRANASQPSCWDVTAPFFEAAKTLGTGTLVKDEFFTLFEAVGALEIMDPKMDSGFLAPGEDLEDYYDVTQPLSAQQVIGVVDQLLCYEMAWHQGYPLLQTLFTSHYIDVLLGSEPSDINQAVFSSQPDTSNDAGGRLVHLVLRAYCVATIKACDFVTQTVTSQNFFEEEDFSSHTYNRNLLVQVSEDHVVALLEEAEGWLEGEGGVSAIELRDVRLGLLSRIRLRKQFLIALCPGLSSEAQVNFNVIPEMLVGLEETHRFAEPVPTSFSQKIQRHLASTVPPRPIINLPFAEAVKKLSLLSKDAAEACRIQQYLKESPQELRNFLWAFNGRKPTPLAFPRAIPQTILFSMPREDWQLLYLKDLAGLVFPEDPVLDPVNWTIEASPRPGAPKHPGAVTAEIIDTFISQTMEGYYDLYTLPCQNRCRVRRMLRHVILFFDSLYNPCENLDTELQELHKDVVEFPLLTWINYQKLCLVEAMVQLGFELDIYLSDELAEMYWWLSRISAHRCGFLENLSAFARERQTRFLREKSIQKASSVEQTFLRLREMACEARSTELLAEAFSIMYMYLQYQHFIPTPRRPLSTAALRYELRMKPFLTVFPPGLPHFDQCYAELHPYGPYDENDFYPGGSDEEDHDKLPPEALRAEKNKLAQEAQRTIKEAKEQLSAVRKMGPGLGGAGCVAEQWEKNIADVLRACVGAGVALATVDKVVMTKGERVGKELSIEIPPSGERYHDWWIVPKVVVKQ